MKKYGPRDFRAGQKVLLGGVGPFQLGYYYDPDDYADGDQWSEDTELEIYIFDPNGSEVKEMYLYSDREFDLLTPFTGTTTSEVDPVPGEWILANTSNVRGKLVFVPDAPSDATPGEATLYTKHIPHDHDWRVNNGSIVCIATGCKDKKKRMVPDFDPKDKSTWTKYTGEIDED